MTRVAITAIGAEYPNAPRDPRENWDETGWELRLERRINRAFGPPCAATPDKARIGVSFTSSKGDIGLLEAGSWGWHPAAAGTILARRFDAQGRFAAPNSACASGAHAIALGAQWIQSGDADVVLAGAIEPPQHPMITAAYRNMGALSKRGLMRPFDKRRDGFINEAGGGFLVLENEATARARDATIMGYVSGWSFHCDAHHITQMAPSGASIERAIRDALARAGDPQIDYINAHGTATVNDLIEARALNRVFGAGVAVSSTKPLTGHLLGAAGAVEAILCVEAMRNQVAPPTLNLEEPEEQIELDLVVGSGRAMEINAALSLNYGFGGHIGCLVFVIK